MKNSRKTWNKDHFRAIITGAAAVVTAGAFLSGCSYSLPEKGTPSAIESTSEDSSEELLSEYTAAIRKAEYYDNILSLSRASSIDKLMTIDGYSEEIADFAVDSINADWRKNALRKAKRYKEAFYMSDTEIFYRLVDADRDNFTVEEADFALMNLG